MFSWLLPFNLSSICDFWKKNSSDVSNDWTVFFTNQLIFFAIFLFNSLIQPSLTKLSPVIEPLAPYIRKSRIWDPRNPVIHPQRGFQNQRLSWITLHRGRYYLFYVQAFPDLETTRWTSICTLPHNRSLENMGTRLKVLQTIPEKRKNTYIKYHCLKVYKRTSWLHNLKMQQ